MSLNGVAKKRSRANGSEKLHSKMTYTPDEMNQILMRRELELEIEFKQKRLAQAAAIAERCGKFTVSALLHLFHIR